MLVSILRKQRGDGQEKVQHKEVISPGDMKRLACPGVFSKDAPWPLLKGVWFYITYYFCRRGCEGLRDLRTDSFQVETDDIGHQYYVMQREERTKDHQGGIENDENDEGKMYDQHAALDSSYCNSIWRRSTTNVVPCFSILHEISRQRCLCGMKIGY